MGNKQTEWTLMEEEKEKKQRIIFYEEKIKETKLYMPSVGKKKLSVYSWGALFG